MLFYNEDWIHFLTTRYNRKEKISREALKTYIDGLCGTQITDFCMNVNGMVSTAESEIMETFSGKYLTTEENGTPVNYTNTYARYAYEMKQEGLDMYEVWIEELRKIGIRPWISFRMNDTHGRVNEPELRKASWVNAEPDNLISAHRKMEIARDMSSNYLKQPVRERMIGYIKEIMHRYDADGIELDFTRECTIFPFGMAHQGKAVLNTVIDEIDDIRRDCERQFGHSVKLSLLMPPHVEMCMSYGFDLLHIAEKADLITIIPHWDSIDTNMPFDVWRALLRDKDVLLGGGQQLLFKQYTGQGSKISSVEMAFGQAMANLSNGADFVYLYNYMDDAINEGMDTWLYPECIRNDAHRRWMFENIGRRETLLGQNRSHLLTFADSVPAWERVTSRLPIRFKKPLPNRTGCRELIRINVGTISQESAAWLVLGFDSSRALENEDFDIYINCKRVHLVKRSKINLNIYEKDCYFFEWKENRFDQAYVEIMIHKECTLEHAEIYVRAQADAGI